MMWIWFSVTGGDCETGRDLHFSHASATTTSTGMMCLMRAGRECEHATERTEDTLLSDSYEQTECPPSSYQEPTLFPRGPPARDFDGSPDPRYVGGKSHEGDRQRGWHRTHETREIDGLLVGRALCRCGGLVRHRLGSWQVLATLGGPERGCGARLVMIGVRNRERVDSRDSLRQRP